MDKEAFSAFVAQDAALCEIQRNDDETTGIKNYINKIKTYMPRFALLMCVTDMCFTGCPAMVTAEHMRRAVALSEYFIKSARAVFAAGERSNEAAVVRRAMVSKGMTKVEQIKDFASKGFAQHEIAKMLNTPRSYVSKILKS